jgi:centromeric protein E
VLKLALGIRSPLTSLNPFEYNLLVAIRMRPLNKAEGDKQRIWKVLPKYNSVTQTTNTGKPLSERITGRTFFTFDKVFGEDDNTVQIYDNVAKGIVSSVVNGLNGTIFAYGQTSSGKTYTMQGSGSIQEGASSHGGGIVHMAAKDIFSQIQSQPNRMFLVRASFLEIYNEDVRDLLSNSSQTLQVREDPRRGVFVQSQEEMVTDYESLLRLLFQGEKSRTVASTQMNERSSRSHTIFRITIESREKDNVDANEDYSESGGDGAVRVSTLNLVDLAGSESVRHTGATGDRQKEGGMINQR